MTDRNAVIRSSRIGHEPRVAVHDDGAVVHRHVERGAGEHDPVDDRHRDAHRVAGLQRPHHPARGRTVDVERCHRPARTPSGSPPVRPGTRCRRGPRARHRARPRRSPRRTGPAPGGGERCCEGSDGIGEVSQGATPIEVQGPASADTPGSRTPVPRPLEDRFRHDRRPPDGTGCRLTPSVARRPGGSVVTIPRPPARAMTGIRRGRGHDRPRRGDLRGAPVDGHHVAVPGDGARRIRARPSRTTRPGRPRVPRPRRTRTGSSHRRPGCRDRGAAPPRSPGTPAAGGLRCARHRRDHRPDRGVRPRDVGRRGRIGRVRRSATPPATARPPPRPRPPRDDHRVRRRPRRHRHPPVTGGS